MKFDIFATDSIGTKYNVEIQRSDKGAGFKRARYNSSMMDANILEKNKDFDILAETYVIFITENDIIGEGEALYPVGRCFLKTGKIFDDGSHIVYVNGAYRDDSSIGKLMHDFSCTQPKDMNYKLLADRSRFLKEEAEGVAIMCKAMEDMRNQTAKEKAVQIAKKMLQNGKLSLEEVAECSGLTVEEVKELTLQPV